MQINNLTPEEISVVLEHRERQKNQAQKRKNRLTLIGIAKNYEEWLQDNNRGSSFSTFTDEFGFDGSKATDVFRLVDEIRRNCAHAEAFYLTDDWAGAFSDRF